MSYENNQKKKGNMVSHVVRHDNMLREGRTEGKKTRRKRMMFLDMMKKKGDNYQHLKQEL